MTFFTRSVAARLASLAIALCLPWGAAAAPYSEQLDRTIERLQQESVVLAAAIKNPDPSIGAPVGPGPAFKLSDVGDRVARLTQRLVALNLLAPADAGDVFTPAVEDAVKALQIDHQLNGDGRVGAATLALLDRTPRQSLADIQDTIAQIHQLRTALPADIVLVNLPSQTVTVIRHGEEVVTMRAVVGRPSRETPLLHDEITHVVVNPTWTVPTTVMKVDKLPLLRRRGNPGIQGASVYLDGAPVLPELVDWSTVSPGRIRIVQAPGDFNALGRFKFNLTNSDSIYLHGTNDPKVFDRDSRSVSSGCVRLQGARVLANMLLADAGITPEKIDKMLDAGDTKWIRLPHPIPVRFIYFTAGVDPQNRVTYYPDIYAMGHRAAAAGSST
ncbi:MAG: L,D-transpeptidase family protein [Azospirillaceae bacterium]|nr:L,D-transpeptidase family protein [Azospirillaceae bacterium]